MFNKLRLSKCAYWLVFGVAGLALYELEKADRAAMEWWVGYVSMPVKRFLGAVVDPLPFSFCEVGVLLLVVLEVVLLVRAIRHRQFARWLVQLAALLVWVVCLVNALWGTQYYGFSFARSAGMTNGAVAAEDLLKVNLYFAEQLNRAAEQVPHWEDGTLGVTVEQVLGESAGLYDGLMEEYPFLAGPERHAKPAFFSYLMSLTGFNGYICPLLGETTVNVDSPVAFLPSTVGHEFAHQRGVAPEMEANFVGIRAAVTSGKPVYAYSGWLLGWLHLNNALYGVNPEAASLCYQSLSDTVKADVQANNAYWKQFEGPVREKSDVVYEEFLHSYDQELGLQSYGACVDLLVEYYKECL